MQIIISKKKIPILISVILEVDEKTGLKYHNRSLLLLWKTVLFSSGLTWTSRHRLVLHLCLTASGAVYFCSSHRYLELLKPPFNLRLKKKNSENSSEPGDWLFHWQGVFANLFNHPRGSFTSFQFVNILLNRGRQKPDKLFQQQLYQCQTKGRLTWWVLLLLLINPKTAIALFAWRAPNYPPKYLPKCHAHILQ